MTEHVEKIVEMIKAKRVELREAQADFAERDRMAKAAKRRVESLYEDLTDLCDQLDPERSEPMLLFDKPADDQAEVETAADAQDDPASDPRWRALSLQALVDCGLPDGVRDLLEQADCFTLGALADLHARAGDLGLGSVVPGIGPKKAEKLADAWEQFWGGWPTLRLTLDPLPGQTPQDATDAAEEPQADPDADDATDEPQAGDEAA